MKRIFVTGISTEVGKTIASAIIVESLMADYWKPIQAGDLDSSDSHKVRSLISNEKSVIHPNSYALNQPMSPHAAAKLDDIEIELAKISVPETNNHLVIEGAGGLLVPLNDNNTILDLIDPDFKVVVVSRHYLGSINHSLLTINLLLQKGFDVSVIFSGNENKGTESIISKMTGVPIIGRINQERLIDRDVIRHYAQLFQVELLSL